MKQRRNSKENTNLKNNFQNTSKQLPRNSICKLSAGAKQKLSTLLKRFVEPRYNEPLYNEV